MFLYIGNQVRIIWPQFTSRENQNSAVIKFLERNALHELEDIFKRLTKSSLTHNIMAGYIFTELYSSSYHVAIGRPLPRSVGSQHGLQSDSEQPVVALHNARGFVTPRT